MINIIERQFDQLAKRIRERVSTLVKGLGAYFKRLLFPSAEQAGSLVKKIK